MTSKSAKVSDFSPYVIFAVKYHRIHDLTAAMIDKILSVFNLCRHKNFWPSPLILDKLCENLLKLLIKYQSTLLGIDCELNSVYKPW